MKLLSVILFFHAQYVFYNLLNVAASFVALILNKYWHNLRKSPPWQWFKLHVEGGV